MRIGLVDHGTGGQHSRAPFIAAARGLKLAGAVARVRATVAKVKAELPNVPVFPGVTEMLKAGVDAVTVTTPPQTRRELVPEAIDAGVPAIADKPFAPIADAGPTGGLLRDLGSHIVDQMLWLLGPAVAVTAHLDEVGRPDGMADASFVLALRPARGVRSSLSSSKLSRLQERELRAHGEAVSHVSSGTDVQAQAVFAGRSPADDLEGRGFGTPDLWGTLRTKDGAEPAPSEPGRDHAGYEAFERAVRTGSALPVTAEEAIHTLEVLDAARISAAEGRTIDLTGASSTP